MKLGGQEFFTCKPNKTILRRAILASVGATAGVALVVSLLGKNPIILKINEEFGMVQKKKSNETLADELKLDYIKLEKNQEDYFLELYIRKTAPNQILSIVNILFEEIDPINSGPLALNIAMKAAEHYKYDRLKLAVAIEYIKGASLEKDFSKARNILELPSLETNPLASYYRGIWWSDTANPSRNLVEAKIHLKFAALHGIKAAEKALIKLERQENKLTIPNSK